MKLLSLIAMLPLFVGALSPDYGACKVYAWEPDVVWFVWEQAPSNPQNIQVTFYLKDLRTGVEFLTGADAPFWISGTAYVQLAYKFSQSDYQIRNLTCVARYEGYTVETSNPGPWTLRHVWLPVAR